MTAQGTSPSADLRLVQTLIDALPDPCVAIDRGAMVMAANPAWYALPLQSEASSGLANYPVGVNYFALCRSTSTEESMHEVRLGIEGVLNGKSSEFAREYLFHTPDGFRWYRKIVRPLGQFGVQALVFHRDITSEKLDKVHSQILDQEFCSLADAAPVLIWMSGPDKGCTFFNRLWLEFTGVRLEEQLGEGWLELVHPEDRGVIHKQYGAAFDEKREFEFEYRLRYKDGSYRWIRDRGLPRFDAEHQMTGFVGSAWDVSDQKQATEAAYKATRQTRLEHKVAVIANSATTVREALQGTLDSVCEILGFEVGHALLIYDDEPELAKPEHILHANDPKRFAGLIDISARMTWPTDLGAPGEVLRSGKPVIHDPMSDYADSARYPRAPAAMKAGLRAAIHLPVLVNDKVEAILEFASEHSFGSDPDLINALLAACERLSRFFERRRAQLIFLRQKEELQASAEKLFAVAGQLVDSQEEERRRIAGEIHDDFTQRLAIVTMKISSLAGRDRALTSAELNADLEDVQKSIAAVAGDLRDLSHQLHPVTLELLGLVRALRAHCEEFQRARGVETTFVSTALADDASPQTAMCLYRVLQESLMNIAKHAVNAKARVTLARLDDQFALRIRDEGPGFLPHETCHKGIGLKNIEERVKLLGGTVLVNSRPGSGTEIEVRVPALARVRQEKVQDGSRPTRLESNSLILPAE